MKRDYPRLDWETFARILLMTGDLDPLYIVLVSVKMSPEQLKRWCLAYWCYYSAGVSSYLSEFKGDGFYQKMMELLPTAPRGHERRHFRGDKAKWAILYLHSQGEPEQVVDDMTMALPDDLLRLNSQPATMRPFISVCQRVQKYRMFGPWIAWKVADMADRVLGLPVDFNNASLAMYEEPVKGGALILKGSPDVEITSAELGSLVKDIIEKMEPLLAPPSYDRPINVQEVETILCKFKAHINGFYPIQNDTHEILEALEAVHWGATAARLKDALHALYAYAENVLEDPATIQS